MSLNKIAKIYKIYDNTNGNVYYGSTIQPLSNRLASHRKDYKRYLEGKTNYITSMEIIKNGNYCISLVEKFEYENKEELSTKERYYIENNECVNKVIPGRTIKEWGQDNKEKIAERQKQYREDNKEYFKQYYEANKEKINEKITCPICGSLVSKRNLSTHQKSKKCQSHLEV